LDYDLIFGISQKGIAWSENLGDGNFSPYQLLIADGISYPTVIHGDIDRDGDQDILAASNPKSRLLWIENLRINTIIDNNNLPNEDQFIIYPNPTRDKITIKSKDVVGFELQLYDIKGSLVKSEKKDSGEKSVTLDVSVLPSNIYTLIIIYKGRFIKAEKIIIMK